MTWMTFYVITAFLAAALTLLLGIYAWRHREAAGASGFAMLMVTITIWSILAALDTLSTTEFAQNFWWNLKYICLATVPVALLSFALQSINNRWLTLRRLFLLLIIPTITQVMIWTNPWHYLWVSRDQYATTWFWIHTAYSFTMIFVSLILVILTTIGAAPLRRRQLVTILVGILIPLAVNILLTFGIIPFVADFTPIAFTFSGALFAWAMYRQRLFDLTPLAREIAIDEMADGMLVLDKDYRVVDNNPVVQHILNLPQSDLHSTSIVEILPGWPQMLDALLSTSLRHNEITLGKDTDERHYEVHLSSLYNRQQALAGYVLLLHDITVRKKAERVIQEYAHELEARNAELETRNAELDAFAHTVAHDLKSPLSTIIGFSALLEKRFSSLSPEKRIENIQRINQIGNKMVNIIDELLLLASVRKMEKVKCQPLDMQVVVDEALERYEEQIREKQAEIHVENHWPVVVGYAPWVEEVWVNYIGNALKYGGRVETQTPPRIELGFSLSGSETASNSNPNIQAPSAGVRFWVRDNGPGLSKEAQSQLFAEFSRLEQTRAEGHGLGLSIVRRIVEKLGGTVGVESVEGQGSTFWFTLPLEDSSVKACSQTNVDSNSMARRMS
ncbi:MAG: PAS domain-containing protein [Anaerolineae bacterium]|nr:PAS domain-containing protein [Anaerolineae bacterium]